MALTGCGAPSHGIIHDRDYQPAYEYATTHCYSYNSKGRCTFSGIVWHHAAAVYQFDLYASAKDHGWRDVTAHDFASYKIGDEYP